MSAFRRYNEARGAIFALAHIGELPSDRTLPLFVSPRVLYILQNLAAADVEQAWRYAVNVQADGYLAVEPGDDDYALFSQIANDVALQLMPELTMGGTLLNISGGILVQTSTGNAAAGSNLLDIQGPSADEAWVIEHISARNQNSVSPFIVFYVTNGTVSIELARYANPGAGANVDFSGQVTLTDDLAIRVLFTGCNAGDDLYAQISGYTMERIV